ncbi:hypothetical protein HAX54_043818, partial [Datura stramonium]|nr:hypothetical protein [Datura stramonium]
VEIQGLIGREKVMMRLSMRLTEKGCLFPSVREPTGMIDVFELDDKTWLPAHQHVLFSCESEVVENYKNEPIAKIKRLHRKLHLTQHQLDRLHFDTFNEWIKEKVKELEDISNIPKDVQFLSKGTTYIARRFKEFNVNNGLIKPRDIYDMEDENSMQFESSIQSVATDLAILENVCDSVYECNNWVRSGVDGIEVDVPQSQAPPDEDEAYFDGGNTLKMKAIYRTCENQSPLDAEKLSAIIKGEQEGTLKERKVHGPTLLKDIWKQPQGKAVVVPFNSRNQAIGKDGRKLASFLGIIARTPELTPLHINDWRSFEKDEKKKLVEFVKAENGIDPTRAQIFILTHEPRKDGDVYSQVLENEKIGYVRDLGLGPTPSALWGSRSSFGNIVEDDSYNEVPDANSDHERVQ